MNPIDPTAARGETRSARAAAQRIVEDFLPSRVLHVGCGDGSLVATLRELGVEAFGVDESQEAVAGIDPAALPFCHVAAADAPIPDAFDVVVCTGVSHHLSPAVASRLIHNLCGCAEEILFAPHSAAWDDPSAINVAGPDHWSSIFARFDFYPVLHHGPDYLGTDAVHLRKISRRIRVAIFSREQAGWAVARIRLLDPLSELERIGRAEVTFISRFDKSVPLDKAIDADVWVVHREFADPELSEGLLEAARALGKPVVFEIDDLVTHLPRSNPMWSYCGRVANDVLATMREADYVTTSTGRLAQELAREEPSIHAKTRVLPNCINTTLWGERPTFAHPTDDTIVIGWFGSMFHDDDLALVRDTIAYLRRRHGNLIRFDFHGYIPPALAGLDGVRLVQSASADMESYVLRARNAVVHIGIAPLTDHPFNHSKSDMKWLEYALHGIPGVYSKVGAYADSVIDGVTGLLVENTTAAWVGAIERLIDDRELRQQLATNAFLAVSRNRTVTGNATRWDALYRSFIVSGRRDLVSALDRDDTAARAWLLRLQARQQRRQGLFAAAAQSLVATIECDPRTAPAVVAGAMELHDDGAIAAAELCLRAVTRMAPEERAGHLSLARLYLTQGDAYLAERVLGSAVAIHEEDPALLNALIELLRERDDHVELARRLRRSVTTYTAPDLVVERAQLLIGLGRMADARHIISVASEAHPAVDFSRLTSALEKARDQVRAPTRISPPGRPRIAVYTSARSTERRANLRLNAPLRVLESMGNIDVSRSDGEVCRDAIERADLVLLHGDFLSIPLAAPLIERARSRQVPVVIDIDELVHERLALAGRSDESATARDELMQVVEACDATIVATEAMRAAITELAPAARDRIVVIESSLDTSLWTACAPPAAEANRDFRIGVFTDWATPAEVANLIHGLAPLLNRSARPVSITAWSPRHRTGVDVGNQALIAGATPFYAEYLRSLRAQALDIALVPVTNHAYYTTLSDDIWCELAAGRVPGLYSARDPFLSSVIHGSSGLMLPDSLEAWLQFTRETMECVSLRQSIANRSWNLVFGERTVESRAMVWAELFSALTNHDMTAEPEMVDERAAAAEHAPA